MTEPAGIVVCSVTLLIALFLVTEVAPVAPVAPVIVPGPGLAVEVPLGTAMLSGPRIPAEPFAPLALPVPSFCRDSLSAGEPSGVVKVSVVRWPEFWLMSAATTTVALPGPTTLSSMDCTEPRTRSS